MKIIHPDQYQPSNWKNGSGVTHEIAQSGGPKGFSWRLSVAQVERDGPFSVFAGMSRILTVIKGNGLLLGADTGGFSAILGKPVAFCGDTLITSTLRDGPVCNFNVIFDPELIDAKVCVLTQSRQLTMPATETLRYAVFCASGQVQVNQARISGGSAALLGGTDKSLELGRDSLALLVSLSEINQRV